MTGNHVRVLFFADTHLGFDYPVRPRIERRRRGLEFFSNYRKVLDHALLTRPDLVIHGGDFFFRSRVPGAVVEEAYRPLLEFAESGIPVIIVPGNHERSCLPCAERIARPGIHVFDHPRTLRMAFRGVSVALAGFPCRRNDVRESFVSLLEETGWRKHRADIHLLLMHQAVDGARVGPSGYRFFNRSDTVNIREIPQGFAAVLCGHIHRRQTLVHETGGNTLSGPVIYPGSTQRPSFAERNEDKGFVEIDFAPGSRQTWVISQIRFKRLPVRPMLDLYLDSSVTRENLRSYLLARIDGLHRDAIVRLRLSGDPDDGTREMISAKLLRDLLPKTMNFQYGHEFYASSGKATRNLRKSNDPVPTNFQGG